MSADRLRVRPSVVACAALAATFLAWAGGASSTEAGAPARRRADTPRPGADVVRGSAPAAGSLPAFLVENTGWTHPEVRWVARCRDYRAFLTDDGVVIGIPERSARRKGQGNFEGQARHETPAANVSIRMEGARSGTPYSGTRRRDGTASFLLGNDATRWRSHVPLHDEVSRTAWGGGIDAVWRIDGADLRFDLRLAPGVDASDVRLRLDGCEAALAPDGSAVLRTGPGEVRLSAPIAWHETADGPRAASVSFSLDGGALAFRCADRDLALPLVIDPVISYAAFFGGSSTDAVNGIGVDLSGNVYVGGYTASTSFPVTGGAYQTVHAGGAGATYPNDFWAAEFQSSGTSLAWCTFVGGSGWDDCYSVLAGNDGSVVLSGESASSNAPVPGGAQTSHGGGSSDGLIVKLNAGGGSLAWGTYLGGSDTDQPIGLWIDPSGNVVTCGWTRSSANFPQASARQSSWGGSTSDGFVTKIAANGASFVFSTFHGGNGLDQCNAVTTDLTGAIYVGGWTNSTNFAVVSPVQAQYTPSSASTPNDAFVSKFASSGASLAWSTYYGGSGFDEVNGIAVDGSGQCAVIGWTSSANFNLKSPIQAGRSGSDDMFLVKFAPTGNSTLFATFLGGSGREFGSALLHDSAGGLWCSGMSTSSNFPLASPIQATFAGGGAASFPDDSVLFRVAADGSRLVFSTYFGGSGYEDTVAIAVDSTDSLHFCGFTNSSDLPVQGGWSGSLGGTMEGFFGRISTVPPAAPTALEATAALLQPVGLRWTDNASNETGFEVDRRVGAQGWTVVKTTPPNVTMTQDAQVSADVTFTYRVRAINADGSSSPSNEVTITTPGAVPLPPPPSSPAGLALTVVSANEIDASWNDLSDDERGFEVQRRVGASAMATLVATGANAERHDDLTCLPGWTYAYRVRAFASAGPSGFTDIVEASTPGTMTFAALKGKLTDSGKPLKDSVKASGTFAFIVAEEDGEDAEPPAFDPRANGLFLHLGREGAGLTLTVAPGAEGWKGKGNRITWTSPKDAAFAAKVTLDLAKRTWSASFAKTTFLASTSLEVHAMLASGSHGGGSSAVWPEVKPGVLQLK
ncbi:MAG: hypothetical protein HMLKMBBP_00444 [Planctomycetes bacterium]|nr:hypothetical protein [Planctomycetota bacterium]